MPKKAAKKPRYFLYREAPFRPLYLMPGKEPQFRPPPHHRDLQQMPAKLRPLLWEFTDRRVARAMCAANNKPDNPCSYADVREFTPLCTPRKSAAPKPTTAMRRKATKEIADRLTAEMQLDLLA